MMTAHAATALERRLPLQRDLGWQPSARTLAEIEWFAAPSVVAQLVQSGTAASAAEGRALLQECKRFLVLTELCRPTRLPLVSRRVDEAFRHLSLQPRVYGTFCTRFFGRYLHPWAVRLEAKGHPMTVGQFAALYADVFGEPLPQVWVDAARAG